EKLPVMNGGGGGIRNSGGCRVMSITRAHPAFRGNSTGLRVARVSVGAPSSEAKTPLPGVAPHTHAYGQRIAALPAAKQVDEVRKELVRRNPGFDGTVEHKIHDDAVAELKFSTLEVTDISPVRALGGLQKLDIGNYPRGKSRLNDLSPLK